MCRKFYASKLHCIFLHWITTQDHGTWKCRAFATDKDGLSVGHSVDIEVFVAVPPENVTLTMGEEPLQGDSVTLRLGSDQSIEIEFECHALGARPAPKFKWLVGEAEVKEGDVEDRPEVEWPDDDGNRDYAQALKYTPSPRDTGKRIRCVVEHPGHRDDDERGREVSARLDLYFKPQPNSMVQTISSGLREGGQEVTVTVRFEARPRPWEGFWTISGVESPVFLGSVSPDGNLNASYVVRGTVDAEHEFAATLTIKGVREEMAGGPNSLTLRNDEGEAVYRFEVGLGESSGTTGRALNAIIVLNVTVLVVIVFVGITCIARFRGIMCFSPDSESCASFRNKL